MPALSFPSGFFLSDSNAQPLESGKLYVGTANLDPTVEANRIDVTLIQQNGTPVTIAPAAQPFVLNAAGMIVYGGAVVQARVESDCSMSVLDQNDVLQYYFPSAQGGSTQVATLLQLLAQSSDPTPAAGTGWVYTKNVAGITELFYEDSAGNVVQFTNGGSLNVDFPTSIVDVLRLIAAEYVQGTQFVGEPITLSIVGGEVTCDISTGTTFSLTLDQNVTNFNMIGMDAAKALSVGIEIINTGAFTITTFVPNVTGWAIYVPTGDSLAPTSNGVTSYGCMIFPAERMHIFPVVMEEWT
jgi:hypothetical protein